MAGEVDVLLRLDEKGFPSLVLPKPLKFIQETVVKIRLLVSQLQANVLPPAYSAVNITGWALRWVGKADIDDLDADKKWDVTGAISSGVGGIFTAALTKTQTSFLANHGYSEILIATNGTAYDMRLPLIYTLAKMGITL